VPVSASLEAVTRRGCILTVSNIGWKNRKRSPQSIKLQACERISNNGNDTTKHFAIKHLLAAIYFSKFSTVFTENCTELFEVTVTYGSKKQTHKQHCISLRSGSKNSLKIQ